MTLENTELGLVSDYSDCVYMCKSVEEFLNYTVVEKAASSYFWIVNRCITPRMLVIFQSFAQALSPSTVHLVVSALTPPSFS